MSDEDKKNKKSEYNKKYFQSNKEEIYKHKRIYNKKNREKINLRTRLYNEKNREKINKRVRLWYKKNPERYKIYYSNRKGFGFDPINDWFEGSHYHHTHENENHDIGIFIPAKLHNSIKHDNKNQESMDRINRAAYEWLG